MILADATVHTTGINWESIAAIATAIVVVVGAFSTWISRQITHAINDLSQTLQLKLETKETVSRIDKRVTILEIQEHDRTYSGAMYGNPGGARGNYGPNPSDPGQEHS